MVRRIVGELIQVGKLAARGEDVSKLEPNFIYTDENKKESGVALNAEYRLVNAKAEAPEGLTLMKVFY